MLWTRWLNDIVPGFLQEIAEESRWKDEKYVTKLWHSVHPDSSSIKTLPPTTHTVGSM